MGLLTDRINNKLEKRNLINEHALNREPVPLKRSEIRPIPRKHSVNYTTVE